MLIYLSFTNACVVSTIFHFRCGCMALPHSKRLGLKYVVVHFRNDVVWSSHLMLSIANRSEGCRAWVLLNYRLLWSDFLLNKSKEVGKRGLQYRTKLSRANSQSEIVINRSHSNPKRANYKSKQSYKYQNSVASFVQVINRHKSSSQSS